MTRSFTRTAIASFAGLALVLLAGCEAGPKQSTQTGYRGTGLNQIVDPDNVIKASAIPPTSYALPPDGGPTAGESYQNVKVLGSLSKDRFDHLMAEITQWVSPEQGCNYCHNPENLASDEVYTKVVARRMVEMTQNINSTWSSHVKETGVTCYTCHRGNAVPTNTWTLAAGTANARSILGNRRGQNAPDPNVGYAALPTDPFAAYLSGKQSIRVASDSALPSASHAVSIQATEQSYGLMMHLSSSLGVNCTYCHNTQSFRAWNLSSAQRATAYYGIRMVRNANEDYIAPLATVFPANRKGPQGDPLKVNCATCHQGQAKPLGGVSMIAQAPALKALPQTAVMAESVPAATMAVPAAFNAPQAMTGTK